MGTPAQAGVIAAYQDLIRIAQESFLPGLADYFSRQLEGYLAANLLD